MRVRSAHPPNGNVDLLTPDNIRMLHAAWHAYWDNSKSIFVEKTPENFLMTRFLQAAFPNSYFVVIKRHPVPVSIGGQKWTVNITSLNRMFKHYLHCYRLFEDDRKYLKHVYELRYKDYVEDPDKYHQEIAEFIGTRVAKPPKEARFASCRSSGIGWGCVFLNTVWKFQEQFTAKSTLTGGRIS